MNRVINSIPLLLLVVFILYIQSCDKNEDPVSTNTNTSTNPYGGDNGKVTFYTTLSSGWSNINVTLQDTNIGTLTHYFNSGVPDCDQTNGTVSAVKKSGSYSYIARSNSNIQWSGTVNINSEQCKTIQLAGNGGGSGQCQWDYWGSLIGVTTSWGPYDLCSSQNTLRVKVTNNANVQMYIKVCIKREDGTYDCGAWWKNPGSSETFYGCPATGIYYILAKPSTVGGECPMPSPPEPNP